MRVNIVVKDLHLRVDLMELGLGYVISLLAILFLVLLLGVYSVVLEEFNSALAEIENHDKKEIDDGNVGADDSVRPPGIGPN